MFNKNCFKDPESLELNPKTGIKSRIIEFCDASKFEVAFRRRRNILHLVFRLELNYTWLVWSMLIIL